ncbi:hypothetical protein BB561_001069 [Smittium simulii]|uniref:Magnesium transporter n=1 Tax=Smittium simulii TaxID=133385 RepID=A0A2T9YWB8_9FUNG|nr:hypothetical protein BB561_001069 [Smittium simulii]
MDTSFSSIFYNQYSNSNFASNQENPDKPQQSILEEDSFDFDLDLDQIFAQYGIETENNLENVYMLKENLRELQVKTNRFNSKLLTSELDYELEFMNTHFDTFTDPPVSSPAPNLHTEKPYTSPDTLTQKHTSKLSLSSEYRYNALKLSRRIRFYSATTGLVCGASLYRLSEYMLPLNKLIFAATHKISLQELIAMDNKNDTALEAQVVDNNKYMLPLNKLIFAATHKISLQELIAMDNKNDTALEAQVVDNNSPKFFVHTEPPRDTKLATETASSVSLTRLENAKISQQSLNIQNQNTQRSHENFYTNSPQTQLHSNQNSASDLDQTSKIYNADENSTLMRSAYFWIDITDPTLQETELLSKIFYIHPLTVEDIMSPELTNDKVDIFSDYTFITYGAIDSDILDNSSDLNSDLKGMSVSPYFIVLKNQCLLTFHNISSVAYTETAIQRVLDLEVSTNKSVITPSYITYAIIDAITDGIEPTTQMIEIEVDTVDELVLILPNSEHKDMLLRLGSARRRILTLFRVLQGKPNVIKVLKREVQKKLNRLESKLFRHNVNTDSSGFISLNNKSSSNMGHSSNQNLQIAENKIRKDDLNNKHVMMSKNTSYGNFEFSTNEQKQHKMELNNFKEIQWLFSDISDHLDYLLSVCTQSEEILSRTHSNHMGKVSLNLALSSESIGGVANILTIIGVVSTPFLIVGGLFGMNISENTIEKYKVSARKTDDPPKSITELSESKLQISESKLQNQNQNFKIKIKTSKSESKLQISESKLQISESKLEISESKLQNRNQNSKIRIKGS